MCDPSKPLPFVCQWVWIRKKKSFLFYFWQVKFSAKLPSPHPQHTTQKDTLDFVIYFLWHLINKFKFMLRYYKPVCKLKITGRDLFSWANTHKNAEFCFVCIFLFGCACACECPVTIENRFSSSLPRSWKTRFCFEFVCVCKISCFSSNFVSYPSLFSILHLINNFWVCFSVWSKHFPNCVCVCVPCVFYFAHPIGFCLWGVWEWLALRSGGAKPFFEF